ncbi:MAG TPA: TIGR03842 family LLM class F420-dependent oxidoreductase, partial [Woeseiaceae bacterium]|nr:TIGR03842 family LLM class F420-dependent oxidoreductase [Woeseiaceae bacterium]
SSMRVMGLKPATLARLAEFTHKLKALARGEEVTYDAIPEPVKFTWAAGHDIPVWIAAYGPKALATAGEHGDGVILQIAEPQLIEWFLKQVRAAGRKAGRDLRNFGVMAAAPAYFGSRQQCIEATRWFPAMVGNHVADIVEKYGSDTDEVPKSLTGYIEKRRGYDYKKHGQSDNPYLDFITDEVVESFCVLGTVNDHLEKLERLAAAGVTQFNIYLDSGDEEIIIANYGKSIIPAMT